VGCLDPSLGRYREGSTGFLGPKTEGPIMTNYAFRYIDEEILASTENIDHMKQIFELPIEEAEALTDDELCEEVTEGLDE